MEPIDFLRRYKFDERLVTGRYYPDRALAVEPGDRIGIVLLNLGGPFRPEDVEPFLYNLFMDPAIIDIPVKGTLRHWLCRFIARRRSETVREEYGLIGGGSPINEITARQARTLEAYLNTNSNPAEGLTFKTYVAMRYWHPTSEEAWQKMRDDNINKVILLPLFPQYSKTTTGSSLHYWWTLRQTGEIGALPTISITEYAAHPLYIKAINARIDEALLDFNPEKRGRVVLLFSAHGTPVSEMKKRRDPYCCLIHSTVDRVMKARPDNRAFRVSFQSKVGPAEWLTPSTPDALKDLAASGQTSVIVVPVAFVSDHVETVFELDIEVRDEAQAHGIEDFVVSGGLNDHPYFIGCLDDVVRSHLVQTQSSEPTRSRIPEPTCFKATERKVACHQCLRITEARRWEETRRNI